MKILVVLLNIAAGCVLVRASVFKHGLDEEFFKDVLDEVHNAQQNTDGPRENVFISKMWPKISALIPEPVTFVAFRENVKIMTYICAAEAEIWPKVGEILNINFEPNEEGNSYVVEAKLVFTNPLNLKIYKECSLKEKSPTVSVSYLFNGLNTVKFWLRVPNFSQVPRDKITAECVVVIDSFSVEKLSERTAERSKLSDDESKKTEEEYWDSVKEADINEIMTISIIKSLADKLLLTENAKENKGKEVEETLELNEKSWICLGYYFKLKVFKFVSSSDENRNKLDADEQEEEMENVKHDTDKLISYEKVHSDKVIESIQIFIKNSILKFLSEPKRDVLVVDFKHKAQTTLKKAYPPPDSEMFYTVHFSTYSPLAFGLIRHYFGIESDYFVTSFCDVPLDGFTSPGASGSTLYRTQDKYLFAKTIELRESDHLMGMLPEYILHIHQTPNTLLPKFYGLYSYLMWMESSIYLIVTNNVFPPKVKIHHRYDLKGSLFNRLAPKSELKKSSPTYRDGDFIVHRPNGIYLKPADHKFLIDTIRKDCKILETYNIMDYSLLLGIHYVDEPGEVSPMEEEEEDVGGGACEADDKLKSTDGDATEIDNINLKIDFLGSEPEDEEELRNIALTGLPAITPKGRKLLLFIGIIDVLQSYEIDRKVQHYFLRLVADKNDISLHNPKFYANRLVQFMEERIFKPLPSCQELKLQKMTIERSKNGNVGQTTRTRSRLKTMFGIQ